MSICSSLIFHKLKDKTPVGNVLSNMSVLRFPTAWMRTLNGPMLPPSVGNRDKGKLKATHWWLLMIEAPVKKCNSMQNLSDLPDDPLQGGQRTGEGQIVEIFIGGDFLIRILLSNEE